MVMQVPASQEGQDVDEEGDGVHAQDVHAHAQEDRIPHLPVRTASTSGSYCTVIAYISHTKCKTMSHECQVSLFCLAIGQDPRDLPVAVVNLENNGEPCRGHPTQCPLEVTFTGLQGNDHLQNFSCRYLSFLDTSIAQPGWRLIKLEGIFY